MTAAGRESQVPPSRTPPLLSTTIVRGFDRHQTVEKLELVVRQRDGRSVMTLGLSVSDHEQNDVAGFSGRRHRAVSEVEARGSEAGPVDPRVRRVRVTGFVVDRSGGGAPDGVEGRLRFAGRDARASCTLQPRRDGCSSDDEDGAVTLSGERQDAVVAQQDHGCSSRVDRRAGAARRRRRHRSEEPLSKWSRGGRRAGRSSAPSTRRDHLRRRLPRWHHARRFRCPASRGRGRRARASTRSSTAPQSETTTPSKPHSSRGSRSGDGGPASRTSPLTRLYEAITIAGQRVRDDVLERREVDLAQRPLADSSALTRMRSVSWLFTAKCLTQAPTRRTGRRATNAAPIRPVRNGSSE